MNRTRPVPGLAAPTADRGLAAMVSRRLTGRFSVDRWGFDADIASLVEPLASLRWSVELDGEELLPKGPALIVHNRRFGLSEPLVLASAIHRATGRAVRFSGVSDREPIRSTLSRIGGVPANQADHRALLRAGELVAVPLSRRSNRARAGTLSEGEVGAALAVGAPVVPVAISGRELGRHWQILIGAPIATKRRKSLSASAALAELLADRVGQLLFAFERHIEED